MKQKFTFYLHDDHDSEGMAECLTQECDLKLSKTALNRILSDRPWYEVGIECEVDDDGNVEFIGIEK